MTLSTSNRGPQSVVFPVVPTPQQSHAHTEAKERGFTQGHAAGYAAGLMMANQEATAAHAQREAEHANHLRTLEARYSAELQTLHQTTSALATRTVPVLVEAEHLIFSYALDLAESLLGYELRDGESAARAALARATGQGGAEVPATVRLNPADLVHLRQGGHDLPESLTLVGDPTLNSGDAVADYPHGFLDARLDTAVARARAALLGESLPAQTGPGDS